MSIKFPARSKTMTLNMTEKEMDVLSEMAAEKGMTKNRPNAASTTPVSIHKHQGKDGYRFDFRMIDANGDVVNMMYVL